jgi:hypothetical protein
MPMNQTDILLPVLALVGWTLLIMLLIPYQRFKAAFAGKVTAKDFRYGESGRVPGEVSLPNRNYMNLLEAPLLFYVVCITLFILQTVDMLALTLAWTYVGSRVLHSLVHVTYNNVYHRLTIFVISNIILLVLWGQLLMMLLN